MRRRPSHSLFHSFATFLVSVSVLLSVAVHARRSAVDDVQQVFVSTLGSDSSGDGSLEKPFASLQRALDSLVAVSDRGTAYVWLRCTSSTGSASSCRYEQTQPVYLPSHIVLATYPLDILAGYGRATLSGGKQLQADGSSKWMPAPCSMAAAPFDETDTNFTCGLWQYDITDVIAPLHGSLVHSIWVDGVRHGLVRSQMLHWLHSLDEENQTAAVNHHGFVYDTFPEYWSLESPASVSQWILTAFHQWASDVHSVKKIITSNTTLIVNEPTYWKYAFDDNIHGNKRFFVENVPEEPMQRASGTFRVVTKASRKLLVYSPPDCLSPAASHVVIPLLAQVLVLNTSENFVLENITLAHTSWLLPLQRPQDFQPASWRHDLQQHYWSTGLHGSGPLPVATAAISVRNSTSISMSNLTFQHLGADGLGMVNVQHIDLVGSWFDDVGASCVTSTEMVDFSIMDCRFTHAGLTWRQGVGVMSSRSTSVSITHNLFANLSSDGLIITTSTHSSVAYNLFESLGDTHDNMSTSISDWGGVHTALPNSTEPTVEVFNNVLRGFRSYSMGGNGLYFDYGSSGVHVHHNLVYNIGASPIFLNSNGDIIEPKDTHPNYVHDNIFVHRHIRAEDYNRILLIRTLTVTNFSCNIIYSDCSSNDTPARLVQDNSHDVKTQFSMQTWDYNVYYNTHHGENQYFAFTFPMALNFSSWQATGHDLHSTIADPLFTDPVTDHFQLKAESPALARVLLRI
eukprot:scpid50990/ scgid23518/ 